MTGLGLVAELRFAGEGGRLGLAGDYGEQGRVLSQCNFGQPIETDQTSVYVIKLNANIPLGWDISGK